LSNTVFGGSYPKTGFDQQRDSGGKDDERRCDKPLRNEHPHEQVVNMIEG